MCYQLQQLPALSARKRKGENEKGTETKRGQRKGDRSIFPLAAAGGLYAKFYLLNFGLPESQSD